MKCKKATNETEGENFDDEEEIDRLLIIPPGII